MVQKLEPDLTKLTPEQRDKLDNYNSTQTQLRHLSDIADMTQEVINLLADNDDTKEIGAVLLDIRESLAALKDKEAPETPDFSKPVIDAISKLEKALTASVKSIDVKPNIKVDAPAVNVSPPSVDLKGVEKAVKEIPKAFEKAIKLIPIPEKPDNAELLQAWQGISEQLDSIDTATRMKPLPGAMNIKGITTVNGKLPVDIDTTGQEAILAELQQKTEPGDIQNVEMINALRALLQMIATPVWYDPVTNTLKVGTHAVTVSSGTITTLTNQTNFGSNSADVMTRDISINTWANVARRTIT